MEIQEPEIEGQDVLRLNDPNFHAENVCLVTGAGTGIGRATAIAAAINGLTVVGIDIDPDEGQRTREIAQTFGGRMEFIQADLTQDAAVADAVAIAARKGTIKFLANIAGIQHIDPVDQFPMAQYDRMQQLMLRAPFYLSQLVIPHMRASEDGSGVIAHMASIHAHICTVKKPVYNITKFGLRALAQSISAEGEGRIRSFTISTGFVKTPLALKQIPAQAEQRGITAEAVVHDVMMGKSRIKEMMSPVEVANLFVFGFSRFARYLIGGDLLFDGGVVLTY